MYTYNGLCTFVLCFLQILMNVRAQRLTTAVLTQTVLTPLGATPALASQDTLEMDSPVLVGWIRTHPKMLFKLIRILSPTIVGIRMDVYIFFLCY